MAVVLAVGSSSPVPAPAATAPPGFVIEPAFPGTDYYLPIQIAFMPDGRKLVAEARGQVWVFTPQGQKRPTPFIDLNEKVMCCGGRGLLGIALDPDFSDNRWAYFLYVVDPDSDSVDHDSDSECYSRLERYQVSETDPNVIDLETRQVLFGTQWSDGVPAADIYHTIGTLRFAPDKSLLVSTGDGAHFDTTDAGGLDPGQFLPGQADSAADIGSFRSLTLDNLAGKVLRLDKETGHGLPTNPYWDGDSMSSRSRIWVYGLRNPYRFCLRPGTGSTDPADGSPGTLYIGDTGWNTFESVYVSRQAGLNFGWPCWEGPIAQPLYQAVVATAAGDTNVLCDAEPSPSNPAPRTAPLLWWHHNEGAQSRPPGWAGRAVIGGVFQSGGNYPAPYAGSYFVTEFINGWTRYAVVDSADSLTGFGDFLTVNNAVERVLDLECDPSSGDLFFVTEQIGNVYGSVFRIRYVPIASPRLVAWRADSATGTAPHPSPGAASPWVDVAGGGHHFILANFSGTPSSGWLGSGTAASPYRLQFDGVDDDATVAGGSIAELQNPTGATASMWLQTGADVGREQFVLDWVEQGGGSTYRGMRLSIADGQLRLWLDPWAGVASVQPNTWYHVVAAKDTAGARVYVNGVLVFTSPSSLLGDQDSPLVLGGPAAGPGSTTGKNFGGAVGEVTLWASGLSGTEALSFYQRTAPLYESSAALVLCFRADSATETSPYPVPGASGPWRDLVADHDAQLAGLSGTLASGWRGTGTPASPWRLQFDGVDDHVVVPASSVSALQNPTSATVAIWFKTGIDIQNYQCVFEWVSGYAQPYSGMAIGISNGFLRALANDWVDVVQVQPDTWYFVTLTKQATASRVYVNGLKRYQNATPNLGGQFSEIVLGANTEAGPGQYQAFFRGAIGMVSVWRRALLDPEVQEHFFEDAAEFLEAPGLAALAVHLAADSALGDSAASVPGASGPWHNLVPGGDATLVNFEGDGLSGWEGDGSSYSPYRLRFDGVDDHVVIPGGSIASLQNASSASVAMWVLAGTDVIRHQYLLEWVSQYERPSPGMSLSIGNGNVRVWTAPWRDLRPVGPLSWFHVVVTKDLDALRAYVDGQLAWAQDASLQGAQVSDLVLGASTYLGPGILGDWLAGAIADVRAWPVSLSFDEVQTLWLSQRAGYPGQWTPAAVDPVAAMPIADLRERPNPFHDDVALEFQLSRPEVVRLDILSVDGRRVRTVSDVRMEAGMHRLSWEGRDDQGMRVGPGLYFARLQWTGHSVTRRLVYLR